MTDREYHVQDNADVAHKEVKIYCNTNKSTELLFCGTHPKPHDTRRLSNNHHLHFDPKLGHGICEILRIQYACVACKSIVGKPWIYGIYSKKQTRYQPVTNCTYWPVIGSFNNWNIIHLSQKPTPFKEFEDISQVVLDGISDNMAWLFQSVKYGTIKIDTTTTNGYIVIKFISEAYTLKNNTKIDGKYYCGWVSCQDTISLIHARNHWLVLGATYTVTWYHSFNTHNYLSTSWCCCNNICSRHT